MHAQARLLAGSLGVHALSDMQRGTLGEVWLEELDLFADVLSDFEPVRAHVDFPREDDDDCQDDLVRASELGQLHVITISAKAGGVHGGYCGMLVLPSLCLLSLLPLPLRSL